jgi:hypothetical protein
VKKSNTGPENPEKLDDPAASSLVDPFPVPKAPGRPRKYTSQAEARAARAVSKRRAHEAAVVTGQIRVTVQVPASHRAAIVAYARLLREAAKAARTKAGLAPRPSDRTRPRPFGPAEQEATLRAWRGGGTLDDLRVAGVDIEQACAWLYAIGEAGSVTEAYRQLLHETNLVRQLDTRDGLIAANRAALPAILAGQVATRTKQKGSAEDQLRKFDSADDAGDDDDDDEEWR